MGPGGNWNKREDALETMRKHQAQAAEQRRKLAKRLQSQTAKSNPTETKEQPPGPDEASVPALKVGAVMEAARQLHLMPFEVELGHPTLLNRPTLVLLNHFFEAMSNGVSATILQWPSGPRDAVLLHPLAMVALLHAPEKRHTGNYVWCEPARSCRTLYFPWRGGAFYAGQRYLVRRTDLTEWNKFHLTRSRAQPGVGSALAEKLHETVGHLHRLRVRETTKPHLAHPALSELYPVFVAEGGDSPPPFFGRAQNELFGRVRFGAALDRMADHRAALAMPGSAPYGLFGVAADADFRRVFASRPLSAKGQPPNICILDLGPAPLSRLGPAWSDRVEEFIGEAVKRLPTMPFLAITQDPFVHRKVETILRSKLRPVKPTSHVQVRVSSDALTADPAVTSWSPITQVRFSTTAGPAADAIAALSDAARSTSDASFASTLRREMGALRKAASLPCGLAPAYDILCDEIGQAAAEAFLERRSSATLLAPIDDALASEIAGPERTRLMAAREAVDSAFKGLNEETPVGSLSAELIASIARKSSRSVIAFATEMDRVLATRRFADESEAGLVLRCRLDRNVIRFTTMEELAGVLTGLENAKDRRHWKRLLVVAPSANQLATLATRHWLPDELTVICERTFAIRLSDTYQRLAAHPDLSGAGQLGARLSAIAQAAKKETEARGVATIDLNLEPTSIALSDDLFIDLSDDDGDGHEAVILTLATGRRLRARSGSAIIRYNPDAEFNPFERAVARDIQPPQNIVVPNAAFIAEAREILPIRVLAERWVEVYHTMIEANVPNIQGDSLSAKARTILAGMRNLGAGSSSHAAVLDWLKVSEHRKLPPEQRRPHAPQNRIEFSAFVAAIGVDPSLAEKMWLEGIQPLRIDRRRAGLKMAQAFVSVLVDPHGTTSHLPTDIRDSIRVLRKRALDYLDQVTDRQVVETEGTP